MTPESLEALLSPDGRAALDDLRREAPTPANEISLITRLRQRYAAPLVAAAVELAKLRERATAKFSRAADMYFTPDGLEQASSERMARHHAARFAPETSVTDLCCGIGGDLIALAARGATGKETRVVGVDRDPLHARIAELNARANGVGEAVQVNVDDVRQFAIDGFDGAFVDPARRANGQRLRPGESEPSLAWCFALAERLGNVAIKAGPALPRDVVPGGWEIEFVSEDRELKEALLWSPALASGRSRATLLPGGETLVAHDSASGTDSARLAVRVPGGYLLDPDPAVTRAGLVESLGAAFCDGADAGGGRCWKVDERIAFLSSDQPMRTPFGRLLRVEASLPWQLGRVREQLRALGMGRVDIRKRGSAVDVDEVLKRLRPEGERAGTLVLTRVGGKPWALVCSSVLT